jgi:ubiquinone/menaquinone biosynthesis C-methylase UbiE
MARSHPVLAALYDPIMRPAERRLFGRLRSELLAPLRGDVLEVGAGTGANFVHYTRNARVLALEPDAAMLARARKRASQCDARITLEYAGDERLDMLAAQSYDAAVLTFVLCTVEDPLRTLARIRRVLRPGGELAVIEHVRSHGALGEWQDRLRPLWERVAGGCQLNRNTAALLAQAGFSTSTLRTVRIPGLIVRDVIAGRALLTA